LSGRSGDSISNGKTTMAAQLQRQTAQDGSHTTHLLQKGHDAHVAGAWAQAEKYYKAALQHAPGNFDLLYRLGLVNQEQGRPAQALRYLNDALKRDPHSADALSTCGLALHKLGRPEEAMTYYNAALEIAPSDAGTVNKLGIALLDLGRPQDALDAFDRALALAPALVEALGNRGNALLKLNRPEEAIGCYDRAARLDGPNARLLTNRAHALRLLDRPQEARDNLHDAIACAPDYAEAHFERGMVQLTLGNFDEGWSEYEWRWRTGAFAPHRRDFKSPLWTGAQSLQGRVILLHGEQGLGDSIQFVRYAPLVANMGATVVLEVQPELVTLMAGVAGIARLLARGDRLPAFDLHCPLMSLPRAFKTGAGNISAQTPYIKVPESQSAAWARRLPSGKRLVGVCWAGRRTHNNDANRSIALERFAPLFEVPEIQFVSLQRELGADDHALLATHGNVIDIGDELRDFADTAALVNRLDAVITVDTAVAHLAGALGKPAMILLPFAADFRWLRGRDDSPWYPGAKLIRQPRFGDWDGAIEQARARLTSI
jgi:hypothetical protein